MPITRRRGGDDEPDEEPRSRRTRSREDDEPDEPRRGRSRSRDDEGDEPKRGRRSRDDDEGDEPPRRSRSRDDDDPPKRRRSRDDDEGKDDNPKRGRREGTRGFASYSSKKRTSSEFADEFKPDADKPVLIHFLDDEPFDSYNQHWVDEGNASGKKKHSFVCRDDEFFPKGDRDCPLCEIGEPARTYTLFNIVDLSNPRKPEVVVWRTPTALSDKLERMSREAKTSPLNREDLYFEVTLVKKKNRVEWDIQAVKARDLEEDFDMEPLTEDEIGEFEEKLFTDRTSVISVDSYNDLAELADSLT